MTATKGGKKTAPEAERSLLILSDCQDPVTVTLIGQVKLLEPSS